MVLGSSWVAVTSSSDFAPALSKQFLDIQATIQCGFTLKNVRDMTRTYNQLKKYNDTWQEKVTKAKSNKIYTNKGVYDFL